MNSARSLRTRAVMALLLMVGFYTFSLAIALGLLWIPYAEYVYLDRLDGRLGLFCVISGITILWALVPRADQFEPPGPRLTPGNAPYLFNIIEDIARTTSQQRPEEVYLLPEVNAFVTHRGGFMGFGSRRVMGVGLPLIEALSPAELRSVIAHEFGHFVSGDVALGPWIYKTRAAIFRAVHGVSGILQWLFTAYGKMFMRMTMQVSREQEFVADATAAKVAGAPAAISALMRVAIIAPAYSSYLNNEVIPVLRAGYLPMVGEGFERYLADPETAKLFQDHAQQQVLGAEVGEYDSHPPTAERIAALRRLKDQPREHPADATGVMLKEPERHIRALIEHTYGKETVAKLRPIAWDDVGAKVYAVMWHQQTVEHTRWLGTLTADQIPIDKTWWLKKGGELSSQHDRADAGTEERIDFTKHVLVCAIGNALVNQGWWIDTSPGRPLNVVKNSQRFEPHIALGMLANGTMNVDEWKATCQSLGISGIQLASGPSATQTRIAENGALGRPASQARLRSARKTG